MSGSILKKIKWLNFYWGIRFFASKSDGLIVMSYFLRNYLKWIAKADIPVIVIPNTINPEISQLRESAIEKDDNYNFGYIGTPTEKDGIKELIDAFAIFAKNKSKVCLYLIGDTLKRDTQLKQIQKIIEAHKLNSQVILTGHIHHNLIGNYLNKCDAFILTRNDNITSRAGFPTKLGEYFCFKKPVILTEVGDFGRYFKDKVNIVFAKPGNPKNIAKSMDYVYTNIRKSEQIGIQGHQWMLENIEYKIVANKLSIFLSSI
jgi:glycosyltransferase involved in cell wall biosynthesis